MQRFKAIGLTHLQPASIMIAMDVFAEIIKIRAEGRKGALATIVASNGSIPSFQAAKMLICEDGSTFGTIGGGCVEAEVWETAKRVMKLERPQKLTFDLNENPKYDSGLVCGGSLEIFIEPIVPPSTLYIFGAGHVGSALHKSASAVGFDTVIVDDRDTYATPERFPGATRIIAEDFEGAFTTLAPSSGSSIVIVTRGHRDDMRVLRWAVQTPARYIGMIGSRRKTITIFQELTSEGIAPEKFNKVCAPIGLDIGAVTPEEIAVAITAELIAVRRRVERSLPHMSWFHTHPPELKKNNAPPVVAPNVEPTAPSESK